MCISFQTVTPGQINEHFKSPLTGAGDWPEVVWQDYLAPILVGDQHGRQAFVGQYGMVPQSRIAAGGKRFSTMNARSETIATLKSYAGPWSSGQLCLVPMMVYFEPNYESGKAQRWQIGMADGSPFAVAGLYRKWVSAEGTALLTFTQITINADTHPVMKRFHKPDDEKRSLVVIAPDRYDDWLNCRNPELAREFLAPSDPEIFTVAEAPKPTPKTTRKPAAQNMELF